MFKWFFPKLEADSVEIQIKELWETHNRLSALVQQVTLIMKKHAEATAQLREDVNFLTEQLVRISEQQNKLAAQIYRDGDLLSKEFSSSVH